MFYSSMYHPLDIRDTINYKQVMKHFNLGPNGGIVTALNLFSTKFESVIQLVKKAGEKKHKYCIIDTPGNSFLSPKFWNKLMMMLTFVIRPNRGVHMVSFREDNHRILGEYVSYNCSLRDGRGTFSAASHFHVKHALCLLNLVQCKIAFYCGHE